MIGNSSLMGNVSPVLLKIMLALHLSLDKIHICRILFSRQSVMSATPVLRISRSACVVATPCAIARKSAGIVADASGPRASLMAEP